MKTMTCKQLGGPCDLAHHGDSADEIINHDADVLHPFDLRWLRLFGQVFRVLSGKIVQSSSWRWECENRFHRFQGLVGRAENSTIVFRAFHMTGISTACFVAR